jgi:hypothetical protein
MTPIGVGTPRRTTVARNLEAELNQVSAEQAAALTIADRDRLIDVGPRFGASVRQPRRYAGDTQEDHSHGHFRDYHRRRRRQPRDDVMSWQAS